MHREEVRSPPLQQEPLHTMPSAIVVGAGLAGLTVAKELADRGFSATVFESSDHAGGKAGAVQVDGIWREHGYHIFPKWYVNTRRITESLGVKLVDLYQWHYIEPGG